MGDGATHPDEPPFPLTEVDRRVLAHTDDEFKNHDWVDLDRIIATNNLSIIKRKPPDLRRYMRRTAEVKSQYGSINQYILANRLPKSWGQPPFTPESRVPFESPADYKALINDWPYGLEPDVTHMVVWSRTLILMDLKTGDLTPQSRVLVQSFVKRYFVDALGPGGEKQVLWFKNWFSLQSVRSLEHIHVLMRDVAEDTLERWTGERCGRSE